MPVSLPVTLSTMNYASVVFMGFGVISLVWYVISGRKNFTGPPVPITMDRHNDILALEAEQVLGGVSTGDEEEVGCSKVLVINKWQ